MGCHCGRIVSKKVVNIAAPDAETGREAADMRRTSFIVLMVAAFLQFGTAGFAQSLATVTFRLSDGEVCKPFSNLDCSNQPRVEVEIGFDNSNGQQALILEAQTVRLGEVSHQLFGHGSSLGKGPQFRRMYLNYRAPITFEEHGDSGVRVRTVIKATRSGIKPRRTSMAVSIADAAQQYQLQYLEVPAPSDICTEWYDTDAQFPKRKCRSTKVESDSQCR